jgi:DNA-binding response OmpR family regulator
MKILCVDSSPDILEVQSLSIVMRWPHATVLKAGDGLSGLTLLDAEDPDMLIMDPNLPDVDGHEVVRRMRISSKIPIVFVSRRNDERDIVKGLSAGADHYITKPFDPLEFLARLQAVLRRACVLPGGDGNEPIALGKIRIIPDTHEVFKNGRQVSLTPIEYSILYQLARNSGHIVTCEALLHKVWGYDMPDGRSLLTTHMANLRSKLGDTAGMQEVIVTHRGVGYRIVKNNHVLSRSH